MMARRHRESQLKSRHFSQLLVMRLSPSRPARRLCRQAAAAPFPTMCPDFGTPDAPQSVPLEAGYKIAPLDTLTVKVFKMPDLSGDYEVDLAGHISMPLIGEIKAYDLTTAQLDESLTRKLGEKYLENPDVSVGIKSSTRRSVTVDGAVNKAGSYPGLWTNDADAGGRCCGRNAAQTPMLAGSRSSAPSAASGRLRRST